MDEASGEYTGREVWHKLHRAGGASTWLGGMRPPNLCVMQPPHGSSHMRPRGEGPLRMGTPRRHWLCSHIYFLLLWGPRESVLVCGELLQG